MKLDGIFSTKLLLWVQEIPFYLYRITVNGVFDKIEVLMQSVMLHYACFWKKSA